MGQKKRVEIESQRGDLTFSRTHWCFKGRARLALQSELDLLHLGLGFCHLHPADADSPSDHCGVL